ncbi:hypothetical protein EHM76_04510 [bacterium]|nr:MAG: hypothetical protein EHM76_04510 [bacterium]
MKSRIVALALLLASCTESHDNTILIDTDVCMLTNDELIEFFTDVVSIAWRALDRPNMPVTEQELVLELVGGALEKCGHAPLDGGT